MKRLKNPWRWLVRSAAISTLCVISGSTAFADHFLYGHMYWKARPDIAPNTAEITVLAAFRLSAFPGDPPYSYPPTVGSTISGPAENYYIGKLSFGDGESYPYYGPLRFRVSGIDAATDTLFAEAIGSSGSYFAQSGETPGILHTYQNAGPYTVIWESCCRPSSLKNSPSAKFRLAATINMATDVSSPVSAAPHTVTCYKGIPICNFTVPAADSDGDTFTWRVAALSDSGADRPPNFTINPSAGLARWDTTNALAGLWTAQIIVDSAAAPGGPIKSTVPIDFLFDLKPGLPPGSPPQFTAPPNTVAPLCGIAPDLVLNKAFAYPIRAVDVEVNGATLLTLEALVLPPGATMTPALPRTANPADSDLAGLQHRWAHIGSYSGRLTRPAFEPIARRLFKCGVIRTAMGCRTCGRRMATRITMSCVNHSVGAGQTIKTSFSKSIT